MICRRLTSLLLLFLLIGSGSLLADEVLVDEPVPEEQPTDEPEAEEEEQPEIESFRIRDADNSFKKFTPSEEISADNAVTFPVDI